MIKTVTYFEYQVLKVIGKNVRILHADDTTATIVIGKQKPIKQSITIYKETMRHEIF